MAQRVIGTTLAIAACFSLAPIAQAQGLLWSLPADGTEVIYGGTMTQTDTRNEGQELTMSWDRQLVIRSVGTQQATVNEKQVPARWIEFELKTGKRTEQGIETGPAGTRVYRLLVPESAITGKPADERGIPHAFLPIIEGYEKIGDQPPRKLTSGAFETFPVLANLMNYKANEIEAAGEESVTVPAGEFNATKYTAGASVESPSVQSVNKATIFVAEEMPFGLVRWTTTTTRSIKDPNQPRDAFAAAAKITTEMEARAINENASATLQVP